MAVESNHNNDPYLAASGGGGESVQWDNPFNSFFTSYGSYLDGFNMMLSVGNGVGPNHFQKAAYDLIAAHLNTS
jgi:hypothetical protein